VFFLLCVAPHPVLGFLTGPCPVGFAGRNHYKTQILENFSNQQFALCFYLLQTVLFPVDVKGNEEENHAVCSSLT